MIGQDQKEKTRCVVSSASVSNGLAEDGVSAGSTVAPPLEVSDVVKRRKELSVGSCPWTSRVLRKACVLLLFSNTCTTRCVTSVRGVYGTRGSGK